MIHVPVLSSRKRNNPNEEGIKSSLVVPPDTTSMKWQELTANHDKIMADIRKPNSIHLDGGVLRERERERNKQYQEQ
jgi:hypothetical protein